MLMLVVVGVLVHVEMLVLVLLDLPLLRCSHSYRLTHYHL